MSEKRLIDFETLGRIINIFKLAPETNLNDVFDELPKPALVDVCSTRKLDSMTEAEIKELLNRPHMTVDNSQKLKVIETIKNEMESELQAQFIKTLKFLIEKGFDVFGVGK